MRSLIACGIVILLALMARHGLSPEAGPVWAFAVLMILTFLGGWLARRLRVPSVLGFIGTGVLLGPHASRLIAPEDLDALMSIKELAFGCVGFQLGASLRGSSPIKLRDFGLALLSMGLLLPLITGALFLSGAPILIALLFGILAFFYDPFLLFVGVEQHPFLRAFMVGGCWIGFLIWGMTVSGIQILYLKEAFSLEMLRPVLEVIGSFVVGLVWAEILRHTCATLKSSASTFAFFAGTLLLAFLSSFFLGLNMAFVGLSAGFFFAYRTTDTATLLHVTDPLSMMAYMPFMGIFGAQLDLGSLPLLWRDSWLIVLVYMACSIVGRGIFLMGWNRLFRVNQPYRSYLGIAALPHGVLVLGLLAPTAAVGLSVSPDFPVWSDIFVGTVTMGILMGSLIFPVFTNWIEANTDKPEMSPEAAASARSETRPR